MRVATHHSGLLLIGCIITPLLVGFLGSIITSGSIPDWYNTLTKPWFMPPNWLFAPVWTLLYCMMGGSLWLIIKNGFESKEVKEGVICFAAQLALNFFWTITFFGLKSPIMGLVVIITLLGLISLTILKFKRVSKPAAYLLIPYLCWTCFATVLNTAIILLN